MYALVFRAIFCQIYGQYVQYNLFSTNTNIAKSRMKWNFYVPGKILALFYEQLGYYKVMDVANWFWALRGEK